MRAPPLFSILLFFKEKAFFCFPLMTIFNAELFSLQSRLYIKSSKASTVNFTSLIFKLVPEIMFRLITHPCIKKKILTGLIL
jgi:hypothetical protein